METMPVTMKVRVRLFQLSATKASSAGGWDSDINYCLTTNLKPRRRGTARPTAAVRRPRGSRVNVTGRLGPSPLL